METHKYKRDGEKWEKKNEDKELEEIGNISRAKRKRGEKELKK